MKTSALLSLAFAAVSLAQGVSDSLTSRDVLDLEFVSRPDDIVLTERELDIEEGILEPTRVDKRLNAPTINTKPVSTKCAAISRRSLAFERRTSTSCSVQGHLKHAGQRTVVHDVIEQRCANTCVCRAATNGNCKSFTWVENAARDGAGRGRCVMFGESLDEMGFVSTPGRGRTFSSRSCYHKGKPPSVVHTETAPLATAPAKRDIDSGLKEALAGIY